MRIAIVTAMAEETLPILKKLGNVVAEDVISGATVRQIETNDDTVYLVTSGIGELRAAMAVQMLVDLFDVEAVCNFGFVGALNPSLEVGETVVVEKAVHYQFDITVVEGNAPGQYDGRADAFFRTDADVISKVQAAAGRPLRLVTAASGDKFVADSAFKKQLRSDFGADVCEMEIAGILLAAERNGLPVFSMKTISDKADEGAEESFENVLKKGLSRFEELVPTALSVLGSKGGKSLPPERSGRRTF